jgi:hypothetical protein
MLAITAKPKHGAQYPNSPLGIRTILHSEHLPVPGVLETWSVNDENESDVKLNGEGQCDLSIDNQWNVDLLSET